MTDLKLYIPPDTLLMPSRDVWEAIVRGEVEDVLRQPDYSVEQKLEELMVIINRERGREVANER